MHYSQDMMLIFVLGSVFTVMLGGVVCLCVYNCRCRRDVIERVKALRIDKMLNHAGIKRSRYLRKASPLTIEKHLLVCKRCSTTDICDECLKQDKDIPENSFCRNFRELIRYR